MDKFMTRQELADALGIGKKKLTNLMVENQIGVEPRKLIPPKTQDEIKEKLGFKSDASEGNKSDRFGFRKR
jgi:phage antirepressor YoqD-like protein